MESKNYAIIDEPKATALSYLVQNPVIILFAAIIIPLFLSLPYLGRYWMPFVWLLVNGYAMGSSTWKKEWIIAIAGIVVMFLIIFGSAFITVIDPELIRPYLRIALNATLFLTLYYAVFTQSGSYELFAYMREDD